MSTTQNGGTGILPVGQTDMAETAMPRTTGVPPVIGNHTMGETPMPPQQDRKEQEGMLK